MSELEKIDVQEVLVKIGGQDRRLVFGMKAAKVLQKKHGNLNTAMTSLAGMAENGLDVDGLEGILFALLSIDKTVTQELVTEWVESIENINDARLLIDAIGKAITAGSPVASGDPTNPAKK